MSNDSRKVQLETELNAEGFESGAERVKAKARDMAGAVQASAQRAADATEGMGAGIKGAGEEFGRAERSIVASLQRTTARLETAGRGARAYQESLIKARGLDPARFEPYLAALDKADKAQRAASGSLGQMGVSAAQTQAALRQLPAQFTDIFTSLSSGQAPLTVLIQQGGQIKDSFGGIGPALRAAASAINPTVLALGALAGGAVALAVAYTKGLSETQGYTEALVLSGNAAGATAGQLQVLAQQVSATVGTQGKAAAVIQQLAASGRVAAADIGQLAEAAIRLERAGGPAAEKTAEAFAKLADSPLAAARKLNEATNFLSAASLSQIKALEDQGRSAEAARVAQEAYATAVSSRSVELEARLGSLQRAWRGLGEDAKWAWDRLLDVGRAETVESKLAAVSEELNRRRRAVGPNLSSRSQGLIDEQGVLQSDARLSRRAAELRAQEAKRVDAFGKFVDLEAANLSPQAALSKSLAEVKALGDAAVQAGERTQQQVDAVTARVVAASAAAQQAFAVAQAGIAAAAQLAQVGLSVQLDTLQAQREQGLIGEVQYLKAVTAAQVEAAQGELKRIQQSIALARRKPDNAAEVVKLRGDEAAKLAEINALQTRGINALATAEVQARERMAKAIGEQEEASRKLVEQINRERVGFEDQRQALDDEFIEMTRGKRAREDVVQKRRENAAAMALEAANAAILEQGYTAETAALYARAAAQQAAAEASRRNLQQGRANEDQDAIRRQILEAQKASDEWVADLRSGLVQTFRSAFLQGGNFGSNFARGLAAEVKARLATALAEVLAGQALSALGVAVLGGASGSGGRGGAGGLLQGASALNNVYSLYSGSGGGYAGTLAAANYANVYSGAAYGTGFGTQQSAMLAAQEAGMVNTSTSALGAYANVYSGAAYGTGFGTQQSAMLAAQEAGMVNTSTSALGAYANVYSGAAYGTGFGTQQSAMLAAQEAGMVNTSTSALAAQEAGMVNTSTSALGAYAAYAALIYAAAQYGSSLYNKGFTGSAQLEDKGWYQVSFEAAKTDVLKKLGLSDKWAEILGGSVRMNHMFGRSEFRLTDTGVTGTLGQGGFAGEQYRIYTAKGGLFRGDERRGVYQAPTADLQAYLGEQAKGLYDAAFGYGQALGLPTQALEKVNTALKVSFGDDEKKNIEALQASLAQYAQDLVNAYGDAVAPLRRYGEDVVDTIGRVSAAITGVNDVLRAIGVTALQASVQGGQAAVALQDVFGGQGGLQQLAGSYLQNFFDEAEQKNLARAGIGRTLEQFGLAVPATRDAFRDLVSAQDLTTESGRKAFAALLSVSDAFASVTDAGRAAAEVLAERNGLQDELDRLTGNDAAIAERERAKIDVGNLDLYDAVQAAKRAAADKAASDEAAQAAEEARQAQLRAWAEAADAAAQAADAARQAWQGALGGLDQEIARLRAGAQASAGTSALWAQFAILSGKARAGDIDAVRALPELSQQLSSRTEGEARTREEAALMTARLASSLEQTRIAAAAAPTTRLDITWSPEAIAVLAELRSEQKRGADAMEAIAEGVVAIRTTA